MTDRITVMQRNVEVDNQTLELNEFGQVQIKRGGVNTNILISDILLPRSIIGATSGSFSVNQADEEIINLLNTNMWIKSQEHSFQVLKDMGMTRIEIDIKHNNFDNNRHYFGFRILKNSSIIFESLTMDLATNNYKKYFTDTDLNENDLIEFEFEGRFQTQNKNISIRNTGLFYALIENEIFKPLIYVEQNGD